MSNHSPVIGSNSSRQAGSNESPQKASSSRWSNDVFHPICAIGSAITTETSSQYIHPSSCMNGSTSPPMSISKTILWSGFLVEPGIPDVPALLNFALETRRELIRLKLPLPQQIARPIPDDGFCPRIENDPAKAISNSQIPKTSCNRPDARGVQPLEPPRPRKRANSSKPYQELFP